MSNKHFKKNQLRRGGWRDNDFVVTDDPISEAAAARPQSYPKVYDGAQRALYAAIKRRGLYYEHENGSYLIMHASDKKKVLFETPDIQAAIDWVDRYV